LFCVRFPTRPQPSGPDYGRSPRIAERRCAQNRAKARSGAVLRICARKYILIWMSDRLSRGAEPVSVPQPNSPEDRLESWKEIASFLRRSIRTVQAWECSEGMPVHRLQHSKSGSVFAFRSELDKWQAQRTVTGETPGIPVPEASGQPSGEATVQENAPRVDIPGGRAAASDEILPSPVPHSGPRISRRVWLGAALSLVLSVVAFLGWRAGRAQENMEPLRAVPLLTLPGVARYPSLSPDGNFVAFAWTGSQQDNPDIYVQQVGYGSPIRLTADSSNDYNPIWSPDGHWIAFLRTESTSPWFDRSQYRLSMPVGKSELKLIRPLGGPERKLAEVWIREAYVIPPYLAWCPDSSCLVVTDSLGEGKPDALFVVSAETGEKRQLTLPPSSALGDSNPALSPDGYSLVFRRNIGGFNGELHWLPLRKELTVRGQSTRLTLAALDAAYPAWTTDGKEILFSARANLWRLAVHGAGPPARLPFVGEDGIMPVVSRPQPNRPPRLAYVRSRADYNIWRIDTSAPGVSSSSPPAISISSTRKDVNPQFSPDGHRIAFESDRAGELEAWLSDLDGSNAVRLATLGAQESRNPRNPRWSPDGQWIAFNSNVEGQEEIYVMPASGGKPHRITFHPANDCCPSFSRDGQWVYFRSHRTGEGRVWKAPVAGGGAVQVTNNVGHVAFESPDGRYVYYTQTANTPSALWRIPVSGGQPTNMLDGVVFRAFVVLENGINYIDQPSGEARLQFFNFATNRSITVARNIANIGPGLTASPDGRTILYTRLDSSVDELMLVENFR
jgi:Tol biopolymer transport system component